MNRALLKTVLSSIFLVFSLFSTLNAKVLQPVQIFLPGNFAGRAVSLSESLQPSPEVCWKAPSLLETFRRFNPDSLNLVFGAGNDSSIFSIPSFSADGLAEHSLINACKVEAAGISPDDMLIFRNSLLSKEIRQRILTNLESAEDYSVFPSHYLHREKDFNIWFFNFIGESEFRGLPLQNWSQIKPENPARSLRRLNPVIAADDISVTTVHMNKNQIMELVKEFNQFPGHHLIIDVATNESQAAFSTIHPEKFARTFVISIHSGHAKLPMLRIVRRNNGYPRLSLKMLPYAKADPGSSAREFAKVRRQLGESLYETLTLITTRVRPTTAPYRFNPELYASFCRSQMRADIAIIAPPDESHKNDNVINPANLFSSFANEKIYLSRLTGFNLEKLVTEIMRTSARPFPAFSGISFQFVADRINAVQIGKFPFQLKRSYNLAVNESLLNDPVTAEIFKNISLEPFDGTTLWDVWKNQVKSLRINSEHLLD